MDLVQKVERTDIAGERTTPERTCGIRKTNNENHYYRNQRKGTFKLKP